MIADRREGVVVALALGCFAILWMLFDTVSLATVDVRNDAREAAAVGAAFRVRLQAPADDGLAVCPVV